MFRSLVLAESSLPTDLLDSDCFRNNVAWVLWLEDADADFFLLPRQVVSTVKIYFISCF